MTGANETPDPIADHPRRKIIKRVEFNSAMRDAAENSSKTSDLELLTRPIEGREYFYEWFVNMRAPASGRMPSLEVFNAAGIRLANAAWDFGYRRLEEEQKLLWIPSAGMRGVDSTNDEGVYLERAEDGSWPSTNPLDYIDPDDIIVVKDEKDSTKFRATHKKSGRYALGKSRLKAHQALINMLIELEDTAADIADVLGSNAD